MKSIKYVLITIGLLLVYISTASANVAINTMNTVNVNNMLLINAAVSMEEDEAYARRASVKQHSNFLKGYIKRSKLIGSYGRDNRNPCEPTLIVNVYGDVYFPCKSK